MDTCFGCPYHFYDEEKDQSFCIHDNEPVEIYCMDLADSPEWCPL